MSNLSKKTWIFYLYMDFKANHSLFPLNPFLLLDEGKLILLSGRIF